MRVFQRMLLTLSLVGQAGLLFAQQPPPASPTTPPEQEGKGQIAGTVVSAKTGELLKGVSLTLRGMGRPGVGGGGGGMGPPLTRSATSGMDGRFEFLELPAGEYDIIANKAGYGGQFSFRPESRVRLASDESRRDVIVRLQPSAVVTGRVLDAYGEPLPEAGVYAMSRRAFPGREPRWMTVQRAQTNDLGEYRIHSLDAGKYVFVAQSPRGTSPRGVAYAEFASSYYPGAPSLEQAAQLKLAYGVEMNGVDFQLDLSPATTVRGIVIDSSTGGPCAGCSVRIIDENSMGIDSGTGTTEEGIFVIHGLQAGKHSVILNAPGAGAPRFFAEKIQVPESGGTEVQLVMGREQTVSGEVVLEDPPAPPPQPQAPNQRPEAQDPSTAPEQRRPMMLSLESTGLFPFPAGRGTVSPKGGTFEFPDVPTGDYRIRIFGMPDGGYLRAVTIDSRDLGGPAITVPRDGPLSGLKLHLAFDGASVSGTVKPAPGEEARGLSGGEFVVAVPDDDSTKYADQSMSRVGQDGAFSIRGLVPGGYLLFLAPSLSVDVNDPDLRQALKPYTKAISLSKKEQARVELTAAPESVELW